MNTKDDNNNNYKFDNWIPNEKKPFVTFSRNKKHYCIYCRKESDTREHIPSKVFLSKPYPDDLSVLPACKKCNNSFSDDELYCEVYIDTLKYLSGYSNHLQKENENRIYRSSAFLDAQYDLKTFYDNGELPKKHRIKRVILKLAVGHLIYELSEGYGGIEWAGNPKSIAYHFAFEMSEKEIDEFDEMVFMNNKVLPAMGTRIYNNLMVFEPVFAPVNNTNNKSNIKCPLGFLNWSDVQDDNYKYIAWMEKEGTFVVKIVIHDFLFAQICFEVNHAL